jgi:lysozyme
MAVGQAEVSSENDLETLYVLIRRFEGCRLMPYLCPAGVWTCGWGSTGPDVFPGRAWSQAYADERLARDAVRFTRAARALCPGLRDDALCAIADFAYNLGLGRLASSTLRKHLNAGRWELARRELRKWVHAGGRRLAGLVLRREAEASLLPA